jgi:8-oxo-dGTP pyrophosphatase MutT (NUDIX family)
VEEEDPTLYAALHRELAEELGARVEVLEHGFVLRHTKADKRLEEHFFICRLLHLDLSQRSGPEFDDPTRGEYIPDAVPLLPNTIRQLNIRTVELQEYLLENLHALRQV